MTVRLQLLTPGLTHAGRRGVLGSDEPLDAHGERDARALRGSLRPGAAVVCSPARACLQSAHLLGVTPTQDPRLRDWDLGRWAGRSLDDLAVEHPVVDDTPILDEFLTAAAQHKSAAFAL